MSRGVSDHGTAVLERDSAPSRSRRGAKRRRRRRARVAAAFVTLISVAAAGSYLLLRGGAEDDQPTTAGIGPSRLVVVAVRTERGPLVAVIGALGEPPPVAVTIPGPVFLTIPGHGEGTVEEAAVLPPASLRTTISNALGVWVDHYALTDKTGFARMVDRVDGISVDLLYEVDIGDGTVGPGTVVLSGAEAVAYLDAQDGTSRAERWELVLAALLAERVTLEEGDLLEVDEPTAVGEIIAGARGATVQLLPTEEVTDGFFVPDAEAVADLATPAFGIFDPPMIPVIVLNGSGEPGVGETVAELLVPRGFQIVVSSNANSFDHKITTIVPAGEDERLAAERIRTLLGVGEVTASGISSNLGDVTIVVGEDFTSE